MRKMILILATALALAPMVISVAKADDKADVVTTVKQALSNINNGDKGAFTAACASQTIVIDDFPPHVWQGATACADWWKDNDALNKKSGITDFKGTLGEPKHIEISGDRAYVVMPVTISYKQNGKPMKEAGGVWTLVLQKGSGGWLIAGAGYAQGRVGKA